MGPEDVVATTGLGEETVRAALTRLTELEMIVSGEDGASLGPNDWDVRDAD